MGLLLPHMASRGIMVDLLHVKGKGPHLPPDISNLRIVELGSSHSFTSLVPLIRYLKREKPDALLSDKDRVNQVALLARRLAGTRTRVVVRSGTTITETLKNRGAAERLRHFLSMRYLYRLADGILTASEGAADDLAGFAGMPRQRISVIPNPVDSKMLFRLASEPVSHPWFSRKTLPVIVGLGELGGSKDYETLIRAFSIFRKGRDARLFIMGDGKKKDRLRALVEELNLAADIHFFGYASNPFPYLNRADLFVQSSRYEGFGMALLEALSLGIPSVATDCPSGPRDILQGGRFGKLVPVGDVHAMAEAISRTLAAPPERRVIMQAALPYSLDRVAGEYIKLLGLSRQAGLEKK
jgi:glycosyltransferase involved in cell wall biosynthesis